MNIQRNTGAQTRPPVVLVIAGHDPSGGAGQVADVQSITACGGHPAVAVSCLTVQDTHNVHAVHPVPPEQLLDQARCVLSDLAVAAIKIGVLPTAALAQATADLLVDHPGLPVVLDPVLVASGGGSLAKADAARVMRDVLVPLATVITPNVPELQALAGVEDPHTAANALLHGGARAVLATDGAGDLADASTDHADRICNTLFRPNQPPVSWTWPRLHPPEGSFHGTGCSLASAIATHLAHGESVEQACQQSQAWLATCLDGAIRPGSGQPIPNRWPGSRGEPSA